ncbi:hypothetical protein L208DRAFT_1335813, partial [Tricholoma matsutake]
LDDDQVKSALMVLEHEEGLDIEIIPIQTKDGISSLAFSFKNILQDYGEEIIEIAMDSTWKTNALKYELYGVVGEANGQALLLAFAFTCSTDGTAAPGAKDCMLQKVLGHIDQYCPNIADVDLDKDPTELSAVCTVLPNAKRHLCYWHVIRYLEQQLAEDKPPAKYDPHITHRTFTIVNLTWAPGITSGWLEEGVQEEDAECEEPVEDNVEPMVH